MAVVLSREVFVSFYSHKDPMKYRFVSLEMKIRMRKEEVKRIDIHQAPVTKFEKCFHFLLL